MNDEAVSQIVATVLMVAITVVLAVLAVSFTFGMTSELKEVKTPAVLAERIDETKIRFTLVSLGNARKVENCKLLRQGEEVCRGLDLEIGVSVFCEALKDIYSLVCEVDNVEQIIWTGRI